MKFITSNGESRGGLARESPVPLTAQETRALNRAERKIAAGLKSFLEVGMALKEIRDKRLYRQHYRTFEEYVFQRWDISRPRAYELCAASEVVAELSAGLSATADKRCLPSNEFQVRPLTRLKAPKHREQAWAMAVEKAASERRPVTAKDTEEAVNELSDKIDTSPVDGVPVLDRVDGIRAAYADPPYVGQAKKRYRCEEVDHRELIERLETYDAWALSLSSASLRQVLPLCPDDVRVAAWVKPFAAFKPNVNPAFAWEPVILKLARPRTRHQPTMRDWVSAKITLERGLCGVKPDDFSFWLFEMLNLRPGDQFFDLYEGSGAVTRAFRRWLALKREIPAPNNGGRRGVSSRR